MRLRTLFSRLCRRPARVPTPAPAPDLVLTLGPTATLADVERVEGMMLSRPHTTAADFPTTHLFAPGVYFRMIVMPAGIPVIGHEHTTEHLNVVLAGRCRVLSDGKVEEIVAPCVFRSEAGVRKVLEIIETTTWATIHPTEETDLGRLESLLIRKSAAFEQHAALRDGAPALATEGAR